jgi:hypothetical protein
MSKLNGAFGCLAVGLLAVYGCSSDEKSGASGTTGGGGGSAAVGGTRSTGGSGVNPAGCPATQPADGTACTNDVLNCNYGNQTCACNPVPGGFGGRGGGGRGQGGQAQALAFQCELNPDAGVASGCANGATCTLGDPNCTDANGDTCRCRPGNGFDAGTTGTYRCFGGGGGFGPGTGGAAGSAN